jgi:hypothetical protein
MPAGGTVVEVVVDTIALVRLISVVENGMQVTWMDERFLPLDLLQ